MTLETMRNMFLYCLIINYGMLLLWFILFALARGWIRKLHGKWFRLSEEQFDAIHYGSMSIYKIGIILLNLVPWIALTIIV